MLRTSLTVTAVLLAAGCGQADDAARIKQLEERLVRADRRADQADQARQLAEQRLEELRRQIEEAEEDEHPGASAAPEDGAEELDGDGGYAEEARDPGW